MTLKDQLVRIQAYAFNSSHNPFQLCCSAFQQPLYQAAATEMYLSDPVHSVSWEEFAQLTVCNTSMISKRVVYNRIVKDIYSIVHDHGEILLKKKKNTQKTNKQTKKQKQNKNEGGGNYYHKFSCEKKGSLTP